MEVEGSEDGGLGRGRWGGVKGRLGWVWVGVLVVVGVIGEETHLRYWLSSEVYGFCTIPCVK